MDLSPAATKLLEAIEAKRARSELARIRSQRSVYDSKDLSQLLTPVSDYTTLESSETPSK